MSIITTRSMTHTQFKSQIVILFFFLKVCPRISKIFKFIISKFECPTKLSPDFIV